MNIVTSSFRGAVALAAVMAAIPAAAWAQAIEPAADEKERLKDCERKLCTTALTKTGSGPLACKLTKTWTKSSIVDGVREKRISWTFGDARCDIDVTLSSEDVVAAMTKDKHTVSFKPHTVACKIEREDEITDVNVTMAPAITFEGGKAKTALLNVDKIEAPTIIKAAIWTVSELEDNFGLFHSEMIGEINEFFAKKCPKRHGNKS